MQQSEIEAAKQELGTAIASSLPRYAEVISGKEELLVLVLAESGERAAREVVAGARDGLRPKWPHVDDIPVIVTSK